MKKARAEGGAAMVEFAILLPVLLLVLIGIIDMGRLLLSEAMVTQAAREGVRMVAMGYTDAQANTRVAASLPSFGPLGGPVNTSYVRCGLAPAPTDGARATVTTTTFAWVALDDIVGLFGATIATPVPRSTAEMRCNG